MKTYLCILANSEDPDHRAPIGDRWPGSALSYTKAVKLHKLWLMSLKNQLGPKGQAATC